MNVLVSVQPSAGCTVAAQDPEIVSVERRKPGTVEVRLNGHAPISMKTSEMLSYPRFRAAVLDATGTLYPPMSQAEWEYRLSRDLGAAA